MMSMFDEDNLAYNDDFVDETNRYSEFLENDDWDCDADCDACDEWDSYEDNLTDVEVDAMTLRDVGFGTDEDYGMFDDEEDSWL